MREYLTPNSIASDIRMRRIQFKGTFVIVEGDTDQRFYGQLLEKNSCQVIAAHSKQNAVCILEILENDRLDGVLAIVDADFSRLDGTANFKPNLLLTDTHDLETMILNSPTLEKLINHIGSIQKVEKLTTEQGKDVRQILLNAGIPIGYLRWISEKKNLCLRFEGIDFGDFIDKSTLSINIIMMINTVKNKSQRHDLDAGHLQKLIDKLASYNHNPWDICCGHDLVCIISIGLRKALGSSDARDVNTDLIERDLRLAYEKSYFLITHLYKSLRIWEEKNLPFRLF